MSSTLGDHSYWLAWYPLTNDSIRFYALLYQRGKRNLTPTPVNLTFADSNNFSFSLGVCLSEGLLYLQKKKKHYWETKNCLNLDQSFSSISLLRSADLYKNQPIRKLERRENGMICCSTSCSRKGKRGRRKKRRERERLIMKKDNEVAQIEMYKLCKPSTSNNCSTNCLPVINIVFVDVEGSFM